MDNPNGLNKAMLMLADDPRVIFIGQNVVYSGNVMYDTLEGVPLNKRMELPVTEEMQMGMAVGMALAGYIPVSQHPRMDFLMLCMNQLVNHLDKLPIISGGQFVPHLIIRTKVGATRPLDAGPQHTQDHTEALRLMLKTVKVVKLIKMEDAVQFYNEALQRGGATLVVEVF